jgi:hypothetical protein
MKKNEKGARPIEINIPSPATCPKPDGEEVGKLPSPIR